MNTILDNLLHVRVDGRSLDVELSRLQLTSDSSDRLVRRAVAGMLDLKQDSLDDHVVDRHTNGNLTIRPQAVFG